jgi:hypothetical protein
VQQRDTTGSSSASEYCLSAPRFVLPLQNPPPQIALT